MEQRFGYSLEALARRFDRSVSWVARRLALVELLPESIQQQVREGTLGAQLAMKYLAPVARVNVDHCERMAAAFVQHHCDTRQAGQLYAAWRDGSRVVRERILAEPELFLKTQRQPPSTEPAAMALDRDLEMAIAILRRASRRLAEALPDMDRGQQQQALGQIESARRELGRMAERIGKEHKAPHAEPVTTNRDSGNECQGSNPTRDCACVAAVAIDSAQSSALQLHSGSGNPTGGESRTLTATDERRSTARDDRQHACGGAARVRPRNDPSARNGSLRGTFRIPLCGTPDRRCQPLGARGTALFVHRKQLSGGPHVRQLGGSKSTSAAVVRPHQRLIQ